MKKISILILLIGVCLLACEDEKDNVFEGLVVGSIEPSSANTGDVVTITGENFGNDKLESVVRFNFQEAEILEASTTQLKVIVPEGNPLGEVMVSVIANKQVAQYSFTYISTRLEVNSISPTSGKTGDVIEIQGKNFSTELTGNVVKFGDQVAEVISATELVLTVKVPANNPGNDVSIIVIKGTEKITGPTFSYSDYVYRVTTLAGSGANAFADGQGTTASFSNPLGMTFDKDGNVLLVDKYNHRIRKITADGTVTTIAGGAQGFADGKGTEAQFSNPYCVVLDAAGNAYITDMSNRRIRKMTPDGVVTTFMGTGEKGSLDGPALSATFNYPLGIDFDKDSNLVVSDYANQNIRRYNKETGEVVTIAGGEKGFADGNGSNAKFSGPSTIVVDANNDIILADRWNYRIRRITKNGDVSTIAGNGTKASVDGIGSEAQFDTPSGIAIDYMGNFLVTDNGSHLIRKVTPEGVVTTFAGSGVAASEDNGGGLFDASFNKPYGIGIDSDNYIYVTEWDGQKIRKFVHD